MNAKLFGRRRRGRGSWCAPPVRAERLEVRLLLSAGDVDQSVGDHGIVRVGQEYRQAEAITRQSDGKLIVAGVREPDHYAGGQKTVLVRYNADGSIDHSFGDGGAATTDVAAGNEE